VRVLVGTAVGVAVGPAMTVNEALALGGDCPPLSAATTTKVPAAWPAGTTKVQLKLPGAGSVELAAAARQVAGEVVTGSPPSVTSMALLAPKPVPVRATVAPGCPVDGLSATAGLPLVALVAVLVAVLVLVGVRVEEIADAVPTGVGVREGEGVAVAGTVKDALALGGDWPLPSTATTA
jgi:hypothetical protein